MTQVSNSAPAPLDFTIRALRESVEPIADQLAKHLAGGSTELRIKCADAIVDDVVEAFVRARGGAGSPEPLAALLRTHPMFLLPEDDTASPTQRQMDEHDRGQRRQRADGLAKWLFAHGAGMVQAERFEENV